MRIATHIHRDDPNGPITKLRSYPKGKKEKFDEQSVTTVVQKIKAGTVYRVGSEKGPKIEVVDRSPASGEYIRSVADGKEVNNLAELETF